MSRSKKAVDIGQMMNDLKLSAREFAEKIGAERGTVYGYAAAPSRMGRAFVSKLEAIFGRSVVEKYTIHQGAIPAEPGFGHSTELHDRDIAFAVRTVFTGLATTTLEQMYQDYKAALGGGPEQGAVVLENLKSLNAELARRKAEAVNYQKPSEKVDQAVHKILKSAIAEVKAGAKHP